VFSPPLEADFWNVVVGTFADGARYELMHDGRVSANANNLDAN
jgi:hypothetical protein